MGNWIENGTIMSPGKTECAIQITDGRDIWLTIQAGRESMEFRKLLIRLIDCAEDTYWARKHGVLLQEQALNVDHICNAYADLMHLPRT